MYAAHKYLEARSWASRSSSSNDSFQLESIWLYSTSPYIILVGTLNHLDPRRSRMMDDALARLPNLSSALWPWPLTPWPPKLTVSCPSAVDQLCRLASKSLHSFSKHRVHRFGDRRTDGQFENTLPPPASLLRRTLPLSVRGGLCLRQPVCCGGLCLRQSVADSASASQSAMADSASVSPWWTLPPPVSLLRRTLSLSVRGGGIKQLKYWQLDLHCT